MPGVSIYFNETKGPPVIFGSQYGLGANLDGSTAAKAYPLQGDLVVLTTNSAYRGPNDPGSPPLDAWIRTLLQADATALFGAATVAAPAAPTITKVSTGGVLPSGHTYYAVVTLVGVSGGETVASAVSNQVTTASATDSIVVTAPTVPANAVGYKVYFGLPDGLNTGPFYLVSGVVGGGTNFVLQNVPLNTEPTPPTGNETGGIAGILGMAVWGARTDTNGLAVSPIIPAGVSPITQPQLALNSVSVSYPPIIDPVTNTIIHSAIDVILANNSNFFRAKLGGSGATVGTASLLNKPAGIVISNTGSAPYTNTYKLDTSLTGLAACVTIRALDITDPTNTHVIFTFNGPYQQATNSGVVYAS